MVRSYAALRQIWTTGIDWWSSLELERASKFSKADTCLSQQSLPISIVSSSTDLEMGAPVLPTSSPSVTHQAPWIVSLLSLSLAPTSICIQVTQAGSTALYPWTVTGAIFPDPWFSTLGCLASTHSLPS